MEPTSPKHFYGGDTEYGCESLTTVGSMVKRRGFKII
jgi:hypothetical protein